MQDRLLTKEEFLERLKTNKDFSDRYGRKHITEGKMVLPPCHYSFQVYTRELTPDERVKYFEKNPESWPDNEISNVPKRAISLMYNTRSQDVPLGTPFNIASYALLLMMIAKQVNMVPDELITNMGDCHIYLNQIDGVKEQITRVPYELPTVKISDRIVNDISEYTLDDIILENYQYHSTIKMPLSN
jgi:thymidylate synthase